MVLLFQKYKYMDGDVVTVKITPVKDKPEDFMEFKYNVIVKTKFFFWKDVKFEKVVG